MAGFKYEVFGQVRWTVPQHTVLECVDRLDVRTLLFLSSCYSLCV